MNLQIRDHTNKISFCVEASSKKEATIKSAAKLGVSTNITIHKPCGNGSYRKI